MHSGNLPVGGCVLAFTNTNTKLSFFFLRFNLPLSLSLSLPSGAAIQSVFVGRFAGDSILQVCRPFRSCYENSNTPNSPNLLFVFGSDHFHWARPWFAVARRLVLALRTGGHGFRRHRPQRYYCFISSSCVQTGRRQAAERYKDRFWAMSTPLHFQRSDVLGNSGFRSLQRRNLSLFRVILVPLCIH